MPTPTPESLAELLQANRIGCRQALRLLGVSTLGVTTAGLQGCAKSPATGHQSIVVCMSEAQERQMNAQAAPHQFSQDPGAIQDPAVNQYVGEMGQRLQGLSHRPDRPYSCRVLNANHVNAYTFPGGAMSVARCIMAGLGSEA